MNKWIKRVVTTLLVATQFVIIPAVSADSLEDIQSQKKTVETELNQVQKDLNEKLAEASDLSISLDKLAIEIEEQENSIKETEKEVEEQEAIVEKRYEYIADQLKVMQKSEMNHNIILGLFEAESLSDLMNRIYTASVLTNANEEHLNEAHLEFTKLDSMKEELVAYKKGLDEKKAETQQQKETLNESLVELKSTLAANQNKLNQLSTKEAALQSEPAEVKSIKTASLNKSEKTASSSESKDSTNQSKPTSSNKSKDSNSQSKPAENTTAGSWMSFQSTGYSTQQKGLSTHTATGINLLVNPRVIAVDPSQIPLGSLVEVQGMGIYVAGDTGGAIKGRIIDVHFPTVGQAMNWGRRNVKIRVLN